ncbi:hypothetical protein [Olivibacter sp. LS-1]|uniref:hypothetical protein n=1 Tax=Olivibacter sp. LS-1 TaxID=2592345 RepID=UPI00143DFFB6|nr:hypothetical protein [Olivibacter sp. LS-1]
MISLLMALAIGLLIFMVKRILDLFTILAFLKKERIPVALKSEKNSAYLFVKDLY